MGATAMAVEAGFVRRPTKQSFGKERTAAELPYVATARGINRLTRPRGRSIAAGVRRFPLQLFQGSEPLGKPGLLDDGIRRLTR
jgi:hypothetical protein